MKKFYSALLLVPASVAIMNAQTFTDSMAFNFTGGIQTYTVPCGVTSVTIKCFGAQGGIGSVGGNSSAGGGGGLGGYAMGSLAVTPGQILNIVVGGQGTAPTGGFNGGGTGGSQNAGGGGGASDVRVNGTALTDRVITAGGGGGGGRGGCELATVAGGNGGAGGGGNGSNGVDAPTPNQAPTGVAGGGAGAIGSNFGARGTGCAGFLGSDGTSGVSGIGGNGGAGQSCCCFSASSIPGGGGGGGGFVGGGGGGGGSAGTTACSGNDKGGGGGGAGGSSDISGVTNGTVTPGLQTGDGMVVICWNNVNVGSIGTVSGPLSVCASNMPATFTLTPVTNAVSYLWSTTGGLSIVSGQGSNTVVVAGSASGNVSVQAIGVCDSSSVATTTLIVNANPIATVSVPQSTICAQDASIAIATAPAGGTLSGTGVVGSNFDPDSANVGTQTITYLYIDSLGCADTATTSITVNLCTGIISNLSDNGAVNITPNPATDNVTVTWAQNLKVATVQIFDANGRLVLSENGVNSNRKEFSISHLPAGNYNVVVKGESGMKTLPFLKK